MDMLFSNQDSDRKPMPPRFQHPPLTHRVELVTGRAETGRIEPTSVVGTTVSALNPMSKPLGQSPRVVAGHELSTFPYRMIWREPDPKLILEIRKRKEFEELMREGYQAMAELNLRTLRDFEHVDRELDWDY